MSVLDIIAACARRLEPPPVALYQQVAHERRTEISALDVATEEAAAKALRYQLAAAARLRSLDDGDTLAAPPASLMDQIASGRTNNVRPPLGDTRLSRAEISECEEQAARHERAAARLPWLVFCIGLQGALLALVAMVDVALLASTFGYLTGGAVFMTAVLSTAGLLMTAAFHFSMKESRDA